MGQYQEKGICQFNICIQCTRDVLILSSKNSTPVWSSSSNKITLDWVCNTGNSHSLQSICPLHRSEESERESGGNHNPYIFQVLDGVTNFHCSSRAVILFLFLYFPWQRQLYRLPFVLFNHNSPHSVDQGINVRITSASQFIYSNYTFCDWENNYRMSSGTYWTY